MKFTTINALVLLGSVLVGATNADANERRRVQDAEIAEVAHIHRNRHLSSVDLACPHDPYYADVTTRLTRVPVIDGNGAEDAWNNAKRLEMFKMSRNTKLRLGYAYVMFDCVTNTWFVKAEMDYKLMPAFCDGSSCDHFVKMNGGAVLANPNKDGKYYPNNMGWELSFPASRAPSGDIDIQIQANVFEDSASQTAGTERSGNCGWIKAVCPSTTTAAGPVAASAVTRVATTPVAAPASSVCVSTSAVVGSSSAVPAQTFYIPMPEEQAFNDVFLKINAGLTKPPVQSLIAISVSTEKTIVWYDHWEDGYDEDVSKFTSKTTEVWGDGNADNGCAPTVKSCTHAADILVAGQVIVIQNAVNVPRVKTEIRYDGGDKIQASYPLAMVRGAYPNEPGSLMAGAVEMLDTKSWGYSFEAPVGTDIGASFQAFELSVMFMMAMEDKTTIKLPGGKTVVLNQGQSSPLWVKLADRIESDKPIQVNFISGDMNSRFEMRWYSLRGVEQYSKTYVSPVGDTRANTKMLVYNPSTRAIQVVVEHFFRTFSCTRLSNGRLSCAVASTRRERYGMDIGAKQVMLTKVVNSGSGAWLNSTSNFLPLSITDTEDYTQDGQGTGGQWYDWGFPVVPRDRLTSEVIIGLGYGCTNNNCGAERVRNVVWISPVVNCDLYIDYQNTGSPIGPFPIEELRSYKVIDPNDKDMSGALIFATRTGTGRFGPGVDIASAWGQDPDVSEENQAISMDMGTVVLPFDAVKVSKTTDKQVVSPGQTLIYTIKVSNVGQKDILAGSLRIVDTLDKGVTYVPGSMSFSSGGSCNIEDGPGGAFPLAAGYAIPFVLPRRGGTVELTFQVRLSHSVTTLKIINTGVVRNSDGKEYPYEETTNVRYTGSVELSKKVYLGQDNGAKCGTIEATEYAEDYVDSPVTYCYRVMNAGISHLNNIKLMDAGLSYEQTLPKLLAPNESTIVFINRSIKKAEKTLATVVGNPAFPDGTDINTIPDVIDEDDAAVGMSPFVPSIKVENTLYLGVDNGAQCGTRIAGESATGIHGTKVVHCFKVTNTGNTHLSDVRLRNKDLGDLQMTFNGVLAPQQTWVLPVPGNITRTLVNSAEASGQPSLKTGLAIPGLDRQTDSDPAGVIKESFSAGIDIQNTVYLGKDDGAKCGSPEAVEFVSDFYGSDVVYCFKVINMGSSHLSSIQITNEALSFKDASIGTLAPGRSAIISQKGQITKDFKNFAVVTANPVTGDGRDIPDLDDVKDEDPSSVGRKAQDPKIAINTLIYAGDSGKLPCGRALNSVEGYSGDIVTYCFIVENKGSSYLNDIVITSDKPQTSIKVNGLLAPGASTTEVFVSKIIGNVTTTGVATGNPATATGVDIPDMANVRAEDPAVAVQLIRQPSIDIQNTVFLGDDKGQGCGTKKALEVVTGAFGDDVTYCFVVVNTGNTFLTNVKVQNLELSYSDNVPVTLKPGQSHTLYLVGSIYKSMTNYVEVVADPAKEDGSLLGMPFVSDNDPSAVARTAVKPNIEIDNRVYKGTDGGKSCSTAVEKVTDIKGTPIQYCFLVKNTGDTILDEIVVVNEDLDYQVTVGKLVPGESKLLTLPSSIDGTLRNKAYASGKPVSDEGKTIPGLGEVSDCDPSEVEKMIHTAKIDVDVTVISGAHIDAKCGSSASKVVQGPYGTPVTYCYKVTNVGKTTLSPSSLSDANVWFFSTISEPLAPGATKMLVFPTRIEKSMTNIANVTGNPITDDGRDIIDLDDVKDSDASQVIMVPFSPMVSLSVTSYIGHDGGKSCKISTDVTSGAFGSLVTYCYLATNTGNSTLSNVYIFDLDLNVERRFNGTVPPGGTVEFSVEQRIMKELTNVGNVTAVPSLNNGEKVPNYPDVTAKDSTKVTIIAHAPAVAIVLQAYAGNDNGAKCNTDKALDYLEEYKDEPITHCALVKNSGNSHLGDLKVTIPGIEGYTKTIARLAPGESHPIFLPKTMTGSIVNTATVVGNPILATGEDIPAAADVSSSDTAELKELVYTPKIDMDNTVYIGATKDNKCGTPEARDFVAGLYGTPAVYCFVVTNRGNTVLADIKITNKDLDYSTSVNGVLKPGENTTVTLGLPITSDLKNMAVVTANPVKPSLVDITGLPDVTAKDDSAVEKLDFVGGITVNTKVAFGNDPKSCETDDALDQLSGIYGTDVVYCFVVKNTGDSHLGDVTLLVPGLGIDKKDIPPLAPGAVFPLTRVSVIAKDETVIATATGNPMTKEGVDIPDLKIVSAVDSLSVVKLVQKASVNVVNTVYLGDDLGDLCATVTTKKVQGNYGAAAVFCLKVENTGETHLNEVRIVVPELTYSYTRPAEMLPLSPGESFLIPVPKTIVSNTGVVAVVEANPVLKNGKDIPDLKKVTASDDSEVSLIPHHAMVHIDATVYIGNTDEGAKCGTPAATNYVENYNGIGVTYCFTVTNTGDSYLDDIAVVVPLLEFQDPAVVDAPLAPGDRVTIAYATTIEGRLTPIATATANPTLKDGSDIPDHKDVKDDDDVMVGQLEYFPGVAVDNVVYLGDDMGVGCESGLEQVTGKMNDKVTYCFNVTNTGDTHLGSVVLENVELSFTDKSIGYLAPGASVLVFKVFPLSANLTNTVKVTANPTLASGMDISGAGDVTDSDTSGVAVAKIPGVTRSGFKPPADPSGCLQDNWKAAGKSGELVCATKDVYLEAIKVKEPMSCSVDDTITISFDGSIRMMKSQKFDVGYYIATDGGDALTGTCSVNGLQSGNSYSVVDKAGSSKVIGSVAWTTNGADGDACGDVFTTADASNIDLPVAMELTVPCKDENEDGILDVAICFTWKCDTTNGLCTISKNIPGALTESCFCTRYDIPGVDVDTPVTDPVAPC